MQQHLFLEAILFLFAFVLTQLLQNRIEKNNEMHFNKNKNATHCYLKINNKLFGTFQL